MLLWNVFQRNPSGGSCPNRCSNIQHGKVRPNNRYTIWIPIVSALLIWLLGFSPIWIIIAAGVGGFLWGKLKQ